MDLNNSGLDKLLKILTIATIGGVLNAVWQISKGQPPQQALVSILLAVLTGALTGILIDEIATVPDWIVYMCIAMSSVFAYSYLSLMEYLVSRVDRRVRKVADDYIEERLKGKDDDK